MEVVNVEELLQKEERTTGSIVVKIDQFLTKDDFRRASEELKKENPNIIVLPAHCDLLYPALIKCKDCKHHGEQNGSGYCMKDGCYGWDDEDYCSRAERKEK